MALASDLAKAVHPRDGHPKVLAMIEAYLDESGIHDEAEICLIGGYFGGVGQWKKCDKLWQKTLSDFDVPLEKFHAKDLVKCAGFFYGWSDDDSYQLQLSLAQAVAQFKIYPVAQGVLVKDFFKLSLNERRFMTGATLTAGGRLKDSGNPNRPYFAPFQPAISTVLSYAPVGGKAHFFFGLGRPFAEYAAKLYWTLQNEGVHRYKERFGTIAFPEAKDTPALQAADLLVHLVYLDMLKRLRENIFHTMSTPSELIKILLCNRRHSNDVVYQDERLMRDTMKQIPIEQYGDLLKEDIA